MSYEQPNPNKFVESITTDNTMTTELTRSEEPPSCEGCTDGASPIYRFDLILKSEGWVTTTRHIWLCAYCQHALAFEEHPLWKP